MIARQNDEATRHPDGMNPTLDDVDSKMLALLMDNARLLTKKIDRSPI